MIATTDMFRLNNLIVDTIAHIDFNASQETICLHLQVIEMDLAFLELCQIELFGPLEVFTVVSWEIQFSNAKKRFGLAKEDKTFEELAVLLPVYLSILGQEEHELFHLPGIT